MTQNPLSADQFKYWYQGKVIDVYDADTITVDVDLGFYIWMRNQKFRLMGIDAAELRGEERQQGLAARDWLREQVLDKDIIIRSYKDRSGKYGRWLTYIYSLDMQICYNSMLVEKGYAIYRDY